MSLIAGLQYLLEYHTLVLFVTLNFVFEFGTAIQSGFQPVSLGPKAATLTIEQHSTGCMKHTLGSVVALLTQICIILENMAAYRMLYLVMSEYRVENVCGEFASNALKSARPQVQQLDVHLQTLDGVLVQAALLAVH